MQKLHLEQEATRKKNEELQLELEAMHKQNAEFALANSDMLKELHLGEDRLKTLQHELSCTAALLKVKDSELKGVMKAIPAKVPEVNANQIDGLAISATKHNLRESIAAVLSSTACQEPPNNIPTKRGGNKRKSESSEGMKETDLMQDHSRPHLQPALSLDHEDSRKPVRRSTRWKASCTNLPEDDVIRPAPSSSVQEQNETTTGKDMQKSLQCKRSHEAVVTSVFKEKEINKQPRKEANLKEVHEAYSSVPGIKDHQVGEGGSSIKDCDLSGAQSSLLFNIAEPPKALEDTDDERVINKQKLKSGKDSATEHINVKCSQTSGPLCHNEKRKPERRSTRCKRSHEAVVASGFKEKEVNKQPQKEANLKEVHEAYSSVPGIEDHQVGEGGSNIEDCDVFTRPLFKPEKKRKRDIVTKKNVFTNIPYNEFRQSMAGKIDLRGSGEAMKERAANMDLEGLKQPMLRRLCTVNNLYHTSSDTNAQLRAIISKYREELRREGQRG